MNIVLIMASLSVLNNSSSDDMHHNLRDLRSNAGLTKVYSLALKDFIIYDSRVAAALAWLVNSWCSNKQQLPPEHLRFACMKANAKDPLSKPRSPNTDIFPYFTASGKIENHLKHATWNLRANWVLRESLDLVIKGQKNKSHAAFQSVRDVEAALFMIGDNLRFELAKTVNRSTAQSPQKP